jgi:acyl-coenzyme A thioesterase PaaI-like protein
VNWTEAIAVERVNDGRFQAHVDEEWTSLQGVHGGIVAALALTATEQVLQRAEVDPAATLRAATFGYVSGNAVGDLTIDVEIVRRGRTLVTTHARAVQQGKTTTIARFHHSSPRGGPEFSDAPPPAVRPAGTVRLHWGDRPAHLNNVETYLHPETALFAGTGRAEWIAWSRPLHSNSLDSAWLTMFGDYFPPAVFTRVTEPQRAVTVEYAIQIHSGTGSWTLGDDEFLAARMHTFHSREGFAVEDGWIHLPDGTLLATVRQTRLAG